MTTETEEVMLQKIEDLEDLNRALENEIKSLKEMVDDLGNAIMRDTENLVKKVNEY